KDQARTLRSAVKKQKTLGVCMTCHRPCHRPATDLSPGVCATAPLIPPAVEHTALPGAGRGVPTAVEREVARAPRRGRPKTAGGDIFALFLPPLDHLSRDLCSRVSCATRCGTVGCCESVRPGNVCG